MYTSSLHIHRRRSSARLPSPLLTAPATGGKKRTPKDCIHIDAAREISAAGVDISTNRQNNPNVGKKEWWEDHPPLPLVLVANPTQLLSCYKCPSSGACRVWAREREISTAGQATLGTSILRTAGAISRFDWIHNRLGTSNQSVQLEWVAEGSCWPDPVAWLTEFTLHERERARLRNRGHHQQLSPPQRKIPFESDGPITVPSVWTRPLLLFRLQRSHHPHHKETERDLLPSPRCQRGLQGCRCSGGIHF